MKEIVNWLFLIILIYLFVISENIIKIILGFFILTLLLYLNIINKKGDSKVDKASNETFYDVLKFILFGILAILYPTLINNYSLTFFLLAIDFIIILFIINFFREKNYK